VHASSDRILAYHDGGPEFNTQQQQQQQKKLAKLQHKEKKDKG
jgi:hypothetical protein